jgi:3D (Asp-Asp-Asp) domain-containing protein
MMQQAVANPSLLHRVAHIAVVAVCTASSLALIGAVPASWTLKAAQASKPAAKTVAPVDSNAGLFFDIRPQIATVVKGIETVAAHAPRTHIRRMEVTAYCPCTKCCGPAAKGITASGKHVSHNDGKFVAADTSVLPFGTKLVIPGYADDAQVQVLDRGGAIKGNKLDLYFPTHAEALTWGRQQVDVIVYE